MMAPVFAHASRADACFVREQVGKVEDRTVFPANRIRLQPGYVSTSRMAVARPTMPPPMTQ
ncbi:hypothetical protein [Mesorhizobium sp. M7A.F.Ca.US.008.03.1.1]|uniref:hypothetical protein n=1 Tax=Mesorhizobium sp. M7A.F.Ca.US.008.03.1.1 TaxID=2496742 RepID=UPI000FCA250F|nr:hypothetical protein [Mesorhizobium sp. M7A.F.Ca.US.008.03.1.1]RUW63679.1 hypothetical protein EOA16_00085 [Mesorhizobium sp. M7A.F.Ca.US.008.03.1.1]